MEFYPLLAVVKSENVFSLYKVIFILGHEVSPLNERNGSKNTFVGLEVF